MDPIAPARRNPRRLPLLTCWVHAGYPSPADDHEDCDLDLFERFVRHPDASFFQRVGGDSMTGAGILHGDYVLVDRSRDPCDGDVVVAEVNGDSVVRWFCKDGDDIQLVAAHPAHKTIPFADGCAVVGVVTSSHRDFTKWVRHAPVRAR